MSNIVIVYHSGYGHTQKLAEAVHAGAQDAGATVRLLAVGDVDDAGWAALDAADAIVFGAPTYMGGPSAQFKQFADATSKAWFTQKWKRQDRRGLHELRDDERRQVLDDSIFRHAVDAAWDGVGRHEPDAGQLEGGHAQRHQLLGGSTGLLAQSPADSTPDEGPLPGDLPRPARHSAGGLPKRPPGGSPAAAEHAPALARRATKGHKTARRPSFRPARCRPAG